MLPLLMTTVMTPIPAAERSQMMGNISIVISVAPAIGPTISGLILSAFDWRFMLILVLPIAIAALIVGSGIVGSGIVGADLTAVMCAQTTTLMTSAASSESATASGISIAFTYGAIISLFAIPAAFFAPQQHSDVIADASGQLASH